MKSILRLGEGVSRKKAKEIISDCTYTKRFRYSNKGKPLNLIAHPYCARFVRHKRLHTSAGIHTTSRDMPLK